MFEDMEYSLQSWLEGGFNEGHAVEVDREVHLVNLPICASTNASLITLSAKISWSGVNFFNFDA